jgi:hypothetical protein
MDVEAPGGGSGTSKITGGGGKGRTISLEAAVHLGHMLQALMTKKKKPPIQRVLVPSFPG